MARASMPTTGATMMGGASKNGEPRGSMDKAIDVLKDVISGLPITGGYSSSAQLFDKVVLPSAHARLKYKLFMRDRVSP